jgi:hypothetical protein
MEPAYERKEGKALPTIMSPGLMLKGYDNNLSSLLGHVFLAALD